MSAVAAIELRAATEGDRDLVFGWRNDPFILGRSSSRRPVGVDEHRAWFAASLRDAGRRLWIVLVGGAPAGLVRFDRVEPGAAVISVYLAERFCGRGHGIAAIRKGVELARAAWPITRVIACVRAENEVARRAFARAGFAAMTGAGPCPAGHAAFVWSA